MVFSNCKTIVITSMSYKNHKTCVAGFAKDTKEWCRIVTNDEESGGAINYKEDLKDSNGFFPQVGDCIKFWFVDNIYREKYQPENYLLDSSKNIEIIKELDLNYIINNSTLINPNEHIYLSNENFVSAKDMSTLNCSILAANVTNFIFYKNRYNKYKCDFWHNGELYKNFAMTMDMDDDTKNFHLEEDVLYDNAYVVVTIGTPYEYQPNDVRYYKFVATVIPFGYES